MRKNVRIFFKDLQYALCTPLNGFTLVEMLMALLIVSILLSASLPVITSRQKQLIQDYNKNSSVPIGVIAIWGSDKALPDNTWLECNGQAIPNGSEYEEIRKIYGKNLPDYRGVFLRGYGTMTHTQNNGSTIGNSTTTHSSAAIGAVQGDTVRNITGNIWSVNNSQNLGAGANGAFFFTSGIGQGQGLWNYNGSYRVGLDSSRVTPVSNEIRPVNKAVRYIIRVRN